MKIDLNARELAKLNHYIENGIWFKVTTFNLSEDEISEINRIWNDFNKNNPDWTNRKIVQQKES